MALFAVTMVMATASTVPRTTTTAVAVARTERLSLKLLRPAPAKKAVNGAENNSNEATKGNGNNYFPRRQQAENKATDKDQEDSAER
tara:strand:- start:659 stop:919 length:261 start_codon:yes stop_codon:yes gene_type:complete